MKVPKLSIIVPVYNNDRYINQCIDSILCQSFKDFELLLIDDGSTDDSGIICDDYAKKDGRIRVFHKKNGGVSSARNLGLKHMQGEWFFFVDADDAIFDNALEYMVSLITDQTSYLMFGYEVYNEDGACIYAIDDRKQCFISKCDALKEMFKPSNYRYQGYIWNKLFKASIIRENNILFAPNIVFNEDRLFNVDYLCNMNGMVHYSTTPVYKYSERQFGAMSSISKQFNPYFISDLDAFIKMKAVMKKVDVDEELWQSFNKSLYYSVCIYYSMCKQFEMFSLKQICKVESRFLAAAGLSNYIHYRRKMLKIN